MTSFRAYRNISPDLRTRSSIWSRFTCYEEYIIFNKNTTCSSISNRKWTMTCWILGMIFFGCVINIDLMFFYPSQATWFCVLSVDWWGKCIQNIYLYIRIWIYIWCDVWDKNHIIIERIFKHYRRVRWVNICAISQHPFCIDGMSEWVSDENRLKSLHTQPI